ncbi:hypothetical protein BV20DRAFT_488536 [Pilatotrama ljubarskyi]|nr:hypothetical protein BV20DRAFT_488536 [Pilatotrama ljubarskyi]
MQKIPNPREAAVLLIADSEVACKQQNSSDLAARASESSTVRPRPLSLVPFFFSSPRRPVRRLLLPALTSCAPAPFPSPPLSTPPLSTPPQAATERARPLKVRGRSRSYEEEDVMPQYLISQALPQSCTLRAPLGARLSRCSPRAWPICERLLSPASPVRPYPSSCVSSETRSSAPSPLTSSLCLLPASSPSRRPLPSALFSRPLISPTSTT